MSDRLPRDFYARDALEVAPELLGALLCRGPVAVKITEVEAYRWPDDTANHGRHGRTSRNDALWGSPGQVYVYLCYGIHHLLNVVTDADGRASAVLIRAAEPVAGIGVIRRRRRNFQGPALLRGPGKVGAALGLDLGWNHHRLYARGGLELRAGERPAKILAGPRVGIGYARPEHRDAPWRFAVAESAWVSHRRRLLPSRRTSQSREA